MDAYAAMDRVYQIEGDRRAEAARIAAEKAEAARVERERQEAVRAERERAAAEEQAKRNAERARIAVAQAQEEAQRIEEQARLDAEAARNRVGTPGDAEIAAKQASFVTTSAQVATLQREALAPRKDGPVFEAENPCPDCNSCTGSPDCSDVHGVRLTAMEALKALVQEIKTGTLLMGVKTSKAFTDAVAVIKAGGL
jgi:multidrug efflux pump subunit AcrA (membrane-fusion protein)